MSERLPYLRYAAALVLMAMAALYGTNIDGAPILSQVQVDQIMNQHTPAALGPYVNAEHPEYIVATTKALEAGRAYRLSMLAHYRPGDTGQGGLTVETQTKASVEVYSRDIATKASTLLQHFDIPASEGSVPLIGTYSNLPANQQIVMRTVGQNLTPVYLQRAQLIDIKPDSTSATADLGGIDYPTFASTIATTFGETTFLGSGGGVGQIFKADSDYLSAVELVPTVVGTGGGGLYHLQLYPVSQSGNQYVVSPQAVAEHNFTAENALGSFSRVLPESGQTVWHLPLPAHLRAGTLYYLSLNGKGVRTNPFNKLGLKAATTSFPYPALHNGNDNDRLSPLAFRLYGATPEVIDGNKLPFAASDQGLGDGQDLYTYTSSHDFSDVLDLDQAAILAEEGQGSISYEPARRAIVAKGTPQLVIPYVFAARRTIDTVQLDMGSGGPDLHGIILSYSFDGSAWTTVDNDQDTGIASAIFSNPTSSSHLYVRASIAPDPLGNQVPNTFSVGTINLRMTTRGQ